MRWREVQSYLEGASAAEVRQQAAVLRAAMTRQQGGHWDDVAVATGNVASLLPYH